MPTVTFLPAVIAADGAAGESVFEIGRRAGVVIETACVGKASCGLCRVKVVSGADSLSPYNDAERRHLGNVYFITRVRLSCQARISGDVTVELAPRRRHSSKL
jgi:2Fe-2S ferredoxin